MMQQPTVLCCIYNKGGLITLKTGMNLKMTAQQLNYISHGLFWLLEFL